MIRRGRRKVLAIAMMVVSALGCATPIQPSEPCVGPPGLYVDAACTVPAPDLISYRPRFPLWSDGTDKERYLRLPPGTLIDGTDPDDWVFPVGTTFYKTFSIDGVRIETRVLEKVRDGVGPGVWAMRAYAWDAAQRGVREVSGDDACPDCEALRRDALGTDHDIPTRAMCRECHSGSRDVVNGFSAVQLAGAGDLSPRGLAAAGRLRIDETAFSAGGAPGDAIERDALGYLHGNCGHCHRAAPARECSADSCCRTPACLTGLRLALRVTDDMPEETDTYATAVGARAIYRGLGWTCRIAPGNPEASVVMARMQERSSPAAMPRIGTEQVDLAGLALVSAWIARLPPGPDECPQ